MLKNTFHVTKFFEKYPLLCFEAGERIKRPKENALSILLIKSGKVRIYTHSESGKEIVLAYLSEEQYKDVVFGFSIEQNKYYIEALTETYVWKAPKKDWIEYLKMYPEESIHYIERLHIFIQLLLEQLETMKTYTANSRIIMLLLFFSQSFGKRKGNAASIPCRITHQMIADYAGLTRETVSQRLKHFKDCELIDYTMKYITIRNEKKLRELIKE